MGCDSYFVFRVLSFLLITGFEMRKYGNCDPFGKTTQTYISVFKKYYTLMMPKKSPVNHTVLAHSKQHLHNKKRRPRREHRYDAGQIPSEGQVRTSHNSKVLEQGQFYVHWFVRVLGLL